MLWQLIHNKKLKTKRVEYRNQVLKGILNKIKNKFKIKNKTKYKVNSINYTHKICSKKLEVKITNKKINHYRSKIYKIVQPKSKQKKT
jgi:uncharacterized protein involved in exopolysaccharide biosynthesis